jgi:hypothetical protein
MRALHDHRGDDLKRLIAATRNPRYWRDRDPELLRLVEMGFRQIYRRRAEREAAAAMDRPERRVA